MTYMQARVMTFLATGPKWYSEIVEAIADAACQHRCIELKLQWLAEQRLIHCPDGAWRRMDHE